MSKITKIIDEKCKNKKSKNTLLLSSFIRHCKKSVQIQNYFWSKYRKIQTRNNSVFGHFLQCLSLALIISIFYCLNYTLLLLHLITTHLVSHLSLSSIIFSISALIIGIFYSLDCISLLLNLIITHLVIDFIITMELTYVLGNYYDLYKYH